MSKQIKVLYSEVASTHDEQNEVHVVLAKLNVEAYPARGAFNGRYVLSSYALGDGEELVDDHRFLNVYSDQKAIREAIRVYDEMLAAHFVPVALAEAVVEEEPQS